MNRQYLISTVKSYREQLLNLKLKRSADEANDLLEELLDAGRNWQLMTPRIHTFVDMAERTIRRCLDSF